MKKVKHLLFFAYTISILACTSNKKNTDINQEVKSFYIEEIKELKQKLSNLKKRVNSGERENILKAYLSTKEHYKRTEFLTELYFPSESKNLNGAPIPEVDHWDDRIYPPRGLQVIEEFVYEDVIPNKELLTEVHNADLQANKILDFMKTQQFTEKNIFKAIRYEWFRIMTWSISGYDSPFSLNFRNESVASINGMLETLDYFKNVTNDEVQLSVIKSYQKKMREAASFLENGDSFDEFDRLQFITKYINPLSSELLKMQEGLVIPIDSFTYTINPRAETLFSENAFDLKAFTPRYNWNTSNKMVDLGRTLFFDPALSGNNQRSCASCHNPDKAFTDGLKKSTAFDFKGTIKRNSPTIVNASLQKASFFDNRSSFLEDQIRDVVANENEMHSSLEIASEKLSKSQEYLKLFSQAFDEEMEEIESIDIQKALGSYVRSLTSLNSRFDQYMRGDESKMSLVEQKGFNLYMGKGKCATCHFVPLFNGTTPPKFKVSESEVIGTPNAPDTINAKLDEDLGRYDFTGMALHIGAFKTPTLRNIALTAPYMHNGVYETLEEVMDFYNRGGGAGIGIELESQTLPPDPLNLTKEEQEHIISFLHTLTDTTNLTSIPQTLPKFNDPKLDNREVGGLY